MSIVQSWRPGIAAGLMWLAGQALAVEAPGAVDTATARAAAAAPAEVHGVVPAARLRGRGTLRFFGLAVYQARLWVGAGFAPGRYEAHPLALELEYARAIEGRTIVERSITEMRRVGGFDEGMAQAWQAALTRAFPDVVPGDRLTGVYQPGHATRFFHNGRLTAAVADPAFGRLFFGIWLAAGTSEPGLRKQLVGGGS